MNSNLLIAFIFCTQIMAKSLSVEIKFPEIGESKAIYDAVMKDYNKNILPIQDKLFNLFIGVSFISVGEIDEKQETLSTVIRLQYMWQDKNIVWNTTEHNVTVMTFGWTDVWKPVFLVTNPQAELSIRHSTERLHDTVFYIPNGWAYFDEIIVTRTTCDLNMTFYPFDIQTCGIHLRIVGESKFPFRVFLLPRRNNRNYSIAEHRTWTLIKDDVSASRGNVQIVLKFERHPLFIFLNILMPVIVIAYLTPIVFVLPKESGERTGFAITMLLAVSVYMTIICDHLPQNSDPLPLILVLLFIWYIMDAVIVAIVIINTRIYKTKGEGPLPYFLRRFVQLSYLIVMKTRRRQIEAGSAEETQKCLTSEPTKDISNDNQNEDNDENEQHLKEEHVIKGLQKERNIDIGNENNATDICKEQHKSYMEERHGETWQELSKCIDKWCFVLFYLLKVAVPVAFFSFIKSGSA